MMQKQVDIKKLTPKQADQVATEIGDATRVIFDKAIADANKILNIFGLEAKFNAVIGPIGKVAESLENSAVKAPKQVKKKKKTNKK